MIVEHKLQHISHLATSPEYKPDEECAPQALRISDVIDKLSSIRDSHGNLPFMSGGNWLLNINEIIAVIWTPEEQAREGGTLRDCVMLG